MTIDTSLLSLFLKKRILLFTACMLTCLNCEAQDNGDAHKKLKHEVSMSCGYLTIMSYGEIFWLRDWENDSWPSPSFHFQYLNNLNSHIGVGLMVDYTYSTQKKRNSSLNKYGQNSLDKEHTDWYTIGPTARAYWFKRDFFAMYSRIGGGFLLPNGRLSDIYFMPTLSPVSFEWGGGNLHFNLELFSIGTLGLINGGMKYSF